jgi:leucyl-tRNA synthetase
MWKALDNTDSVHEQEWPSYNPEKLIDSNTTIVVQVQGRVRAELVVSRDTDEKVVEKMALEHEQVKKWIEGKEVTKIIQVKNKLINIVIQ